MGSPPIVGRKRRGPPREDDALTPIQDETMRLIYMSFAKGVTQISIREIGAARGGRTNHAVACGLKTLERKGYIERDYNIKRGIRITALPVFVPGPSAIAVLGGFLPKRRGYAGV